MLRNAAKVTEMPGWSRLVSDSPSLVADAFKAVAHKTPTTSALSPPRKRTRGSSNG